MKLGSGGTAMRPSTEDSQASHHPVTVRDASTVCGNDTKTCTKCVEAKPLADFYKKRKSRDGADWMCKECVRDYNKKRGAENARRYYAAHKEEIKARLDPAHERERLRQWRSINREKVMAQKSRNWKRILSDENRYSAYRERHTKAFQSGRDECRDSYVRMCIKQKEKILARDIPEDLILMKRAQLQLHRATKQLLQAIKEKQA